MTIRTFRSLEEAGRAIRADMTSRDRRMHTAVRKTARQTRNWVARNMPRAFGELADSLDVQDSATGSAIIADAPHAAAVENGSRPHRPPLDPLIAWVRLRGLQGLTVHGHVRTDRWIQKRRNAPAKSVAQEIRTRLGRHGAAQWRANAGTPAGEDDPVTLDIARRIQHAISVNGTKPHKYMMAGIPIAREELAHFVSEGLPDRE